MQRLQNTLKVTERTQNKQKKDTWSRVKQVIAAGKLLNHDKDAQ